MSICLIFFVMFLLLSISLFLLSLLLIWWDKLGRSVVNYRKKWIYDWTTQFIPSNYYTVDNYTTIYY